MLNHFFFESAVFYRLLTAIWATCLLPIELWRGFSNKDVNPFHGPILTGRKVRKHLSILYCSHRLYDRIYHVKSRERISSLIRIFFLQRFLLSKGISLQTLKEIKTVSGTTINDILMSCLSAALARMFCKR